MYMAPERISGDSYSCVSDSWSMGVVLFSLATGGYPFAVDDGFFGLEEAIVNDPLPPMPNRFSPECRDFVKSLLRRDPETRLTADKAISHPFLRAYDGSSAHQNFMERWQELPVKSCVGHEDVSRIAQLIVDYSSRYPQMVSVPNMETSSPTNVTSEGKGAPKRGLFNHLAQLFTPKRAYANLPGAPMGLSTESEMHRLARDCGVSPDHFQTLFEQVRHLFLDHRVPWELVLTTLISLGKRPCLVHPPYLRSKMWYLAAIARLPDRSSSILVITDFVACFIFPTRFLSLTSSSC